MKNRVITVFAIVGAVVAIAGTVTYILNFGRKKLYRGNSAD